MFSFLFFISQEVLVCYFVDIVLNFILELKKYSCFNEKMDLLIVKRRLKSASKPFSKKLYHHINFISMLI